jgi:hypothetical protein
MDQRLTNRNGETEAHTRLKRLALLWAQKQGYSACALEVTLSRCRYRADVAAYRPSGKQSGATAIFECKQALVDLRRDNGCTSTTMRRLEKVHHRREVLEKNLRVHYPALRVADSLFAEFDSHNFSAIEHRGYKQVVRQMQALQNRLFDCTKFERLIRYRCANLFFLVLPNELFREPEIPIGWGTLIESNGELVLARKPAWHDTESESQLRFLHRIAIAGTRVLNRALNITFDDVGTSRGRSYPRLTSKLRPVISFGFSIPSKDKSVGATSAKIPSSHRNCPASFAT